MTLENYKHSYDEKKIANEFIKEIFRTFTVMMGQYV